jgi:DNA-binding NtrC family response regulator
MERYREFTFHDAIKQFERDYIIHQIKRYGTITRTARAVGLSRRAVYDLIIRHGINWKRNTIRE